MLKRALLHRHIKHAVGLDNLRNSDDRRAFDAFLLHYVHKHVNAVLAIGHSLRDVCVLHELDYPCNAVPNRLAVDHLAEDFILCCPDGHSQGDVFAVDAELDSDEQLARKLGKLIGLQLFPLVPADC